MRRNSRVCEVWRDMRVWLIDEVSMLSGELFDGAM
jgi:hypothetical protein